MRTAAQLAAMMASLTAKAEALEAAIPGMDEGRATVAVQEMQLLDAQIAMLTEHTEVADVAWCVVAALGSIFSRQGAPA